MQPLLEMEQIEPSGIVELSSLGRTCFHGAAAQRARIPDIRS
jgi:hypothetical protein